MSADPAAHQVAELRRAGHLPTPTTNGDYRQETSVSEADSYGYDPANWGDQPEAEGICGACGEPCTDDDGCECPDDCPVPAGPTNPTRR